MPYDLMTNRIPKIVVTLLIYGVTFYVFAKLTDLLG